MGMKTAKVDVFWTLQTKVPNKQDDAWIMARLIKQLTDMGFPVSNKCAFLEVLL